MNRATLVACVVAALVSGCAGRSAVRQVAADLQAVHTEIDLFRQAQDDLSRRLIEVEAAAQASHTRTEELQATMAATVSDMERLVEQLDEAHEAIVSMREELATRSAVPTPAPPPAVPEPPKEARTGSAETAYAAGLANFRGREYGQAVLDFLDVVTKHPSHPLAPSAQYWIGEAYYLQYDYRQALVEFQRVLDWGSLTNPKAPEALVKAGLCYSNLREDARALAAWRRVLREFPNSPSADQARTLLARRGPTR
jgi:tol-pal system protein YbgF